MIENPQAFAEAWCEAWNRHDIEAVLDHFHDDVVFASPVASTVVPESGGIIRGKASLRDYWRLALAKVPDLQFSIIGIYIGVDAVVIHYRNQRGVEVNEVLLFEGSKVRQGFGTYRE